MTLKEEIKLAIAEHMAANDYKVGEPLTPLYELVSSVVSKALQQAEQRIESEKVDSATSNEVAYNLAIEHSLKSLRELREGLKG